MSSKKWLLRYRSNTRNIVPMIMMIAVHVTESDLPKKNPAVLFFVSFRTVCFFPHVRPSYTCGFRRVSLIVYVI